MKNYPTPKSPLHAHHRLIRKILDSVSSKKAEHRRDEYDLINLVFKKSGGSWENIFLGDTRQIDLLKKVIKIAFKKGYITKKDSWVS
tara:strand:- start:117 stop:377 length:261 start_codon:yes stop_codon:yes gene_type:complete